MDHPAALVVAGVVFLVLCGLVTWQRLRCLKRTRRDRELLRELTTGRDLLEAVFEATSDAILVLDENFRVVSANRTAAARFGCDMDAFIGCEILTLTDPAIMESRRDRYRLALETGRPIAFRDVRDGRSLENVLHPLPPGPGGERRLAVYARDVTRELASRQMLAESRDRLAKILRLTPVGIAIATSPDNRYLEVNETFLAGTGYTRQDVIGRTPEELGFSIVPADRARIENALASEGLIQNIELEYRLRGGDKGTVLFSAITLEAYGQPCMLSVIVDITVRKAMEQALLLAKDEAEAASQTQLRFLSVMSHEVRTPMNTILGMVDLLRDSGLTSRQEEFLAALEQAGEGLLALLSDILDVSRIQSGRLRLAREPFQPCALAREALAAHAARAEAKGLALSLVEAQDAPQEAVGDPARIRQILDNLLDNAVKFTRVGAVRLNVGLERDAAKVVRLVFAVTDTGIGIPPEKQERIFEPFAQADGAATSRPFGGTGLGLTLSAMLARSMGGRLRLASRPGKGSVFTVTLPLALPDAAQEEATFVL